MGHYPTSHKGEKHVTGYQQHGNGRYLGRRAQ
jgi:hypothetical protein